MWSSNDTSFIDEFIGEVQQRARLASREEAERATCAVLETLAERLASGEPDDLAAQVPPQLAHHLQHERAGLGERFTVKEFFARVSHREGVTLPQATLHTGAVMAVLCEAVSAGEISDVRAQLPAEFDRLFEASNRGTMSMAR